MLIECLVILWWWVLLTYLVNIVQLHLVINWLLFYLWLQVQVKSKVKETHFSEVFVKEIILMYLNLYVTIFYLKLFRQGQDCHTWNLEAFQVCLSTILHLLKEYSFKFVIVIFQHHKRNLNSCFCLWNILINCLIDNFLGGWN